MITSTSAGLTKISDSDFVKFRDFFYRKTGIRFEDGKRYFVDKRLIDRTNTNGHKSFGAYFTWMRLQESQEEFQHLVNAMTVNETYFYREEYQFKCMVESVLPEIAKKKRRNGEIRIWSIPSSTGEEPYSIVLYLLEKWPDLDNYDIEIVSSDIDTNCIKACHKGLYSERSVKGLPPDIQRKYFTKVGTNQYQLSQDIIDSVHFTQVNLSDPRHTRSYRNFDLIFCRNLLIYFDDKSRRQAAEVFYDALYAGGFIFLGHSESMSRISSLFKVKKFPRAIVYQKPDNEG